MIPSEFSRSPNPNLRPPRAAGQFRPRRTCPPPSATSLRPIGVCHLTAASALTHSARDTSAPPPSLSSPSTAPGPRGPSTARLAPHRARAAAMRTQLRRRPCPELLPARPCHLEFVASSRTLPPRRTSSLIAGPRSGRHRPADERHCPAPPSSFPASPACPHPVSLSLSRASFVTSGASPSAAGHLRHRIRLPKSRICPFLPVPPCPAASGHPRSLPPPPWLASASVGGWGRDPPRAGRLPFARSSPAAASYLAQLQACPPHHRTGP